MSHGAKQADQDGVRHEQDVEAMLRDVYRMHGWSAAELVTPLSALLAPDGQQTAEDYEIGAAMLRRFFVWLFQGGPDPRKVSQRVYVVARALDPSLLLSMSGEQVSVIFGQGRAAESARLRMLAGLYVKAGYKNTQFRVGKSATAKERMRRSAMGNKNRAGKTRTKRESAPALAAPIAAVA
jgi:hypothetical protein